MRFCQQVLFFVLTRGKVRHEYDYDVTRILTFHTGLRKPFDRLCGRSYINEGFRKRISVDGT